MSAGPHYTYSMMQVRFALLSTSTFSRSDTVTDSEAFYLSLFDLLDDVRERRDVRLLVEWWNRSVSMHLVYYPALKTSQENLSPLVTRIYPCPSRRKSIGPDQTDACSGGAAAEYYLGRMYHLYLFSMSSRIKRIGFRIRLRNLRWWVYLDCPRSTNQPVQKKGANLMNPCIFSATAVCLLAGWGCGMWLGISSTFNAFIIYMLVNDTCSNVVDILISLLLQI
jgi:hypothetical protein